MCFIPQANGARRRSGRKTGTRATKSALAEFKVVVHGSKVVCHDVILTDLNKMADYHDWP